MALSRQAKKFRDQEPSQVRTPAASKKGATPQAKAPPSAKPVEAPLPPPPPPEPVTPPPVVEVKPGKRQRKPTKQPRFVYVPPKAEEKPAEKPATPLAADAPRSSKLSAKLMTKNLALPPDEDAPGGQFPAAYTRL